MNLDKHTEPWVAVVGVGTQAQALMAGLSRADLHTLAFASRTDLMHCSEPRAPQVIVWDILAVAGGSLALPVGWDVPVIVAGRHESLAADEAAPDLADSGAHHWLAEITPSTWPMALAFAQAVHRREQAQRQRIEGLQAELEAQRLVARAKGLLMASQDLNENDAFALLRRGAMQTRLPMAEMARAVVDAAIWAEAVNRAGQLRWLSQRCIAAAAQRLARIDPPAARRVQQDALRRAREILEGLARLPLPDGAQAALAAADAAWRTLKICLDQRLVPASLSEADAAADLALECAEVLTSHLQAGGTSPMLRVVNLCGRQRMRAQRLVKLGLLARLHPAVGTADEVAALVASFNAAMQELTSLPLGSREISAAHQLAVERWRDMVGALQTAEAAALVRCGEALLTSVDDLTLCWERSLQLLLG